MSLVARKQAGRTGPLVMAAVILLLVAGGLVWCLLGGRRVNVVLISIDTCRPDYLGCYGQTAKTTPNLDALARSGWLFRRVLTPVPLTLPAHASMLTGTVPPYHGVHGNHAYRLDDSNVTLAELLKSHGFRTAAFVASFVLDSQFGLDQGFEVYDDFFGEDRAGAMILNMRRANEVNQEVFPWLAQQGREPFFLFVHYYDPHYPYDAPPPFGAIFADAPYAGEVAFTDHQIGELLAELKRLGLYDDTLVIVTSDHGESLNEHGESTHGFFVYHSTMKVPLIIRLPGDRSAGVVEDTVGLVDLVPTILDVLDIPAPSPVHGQSVAGHWAGGATPGPSRHFYGESLLATTFHCNSLLSMEDRQWKYIQTTRSELYDLINDPREEHNVITDRPSESRQLQLRLQAYLQDHTRVDLASDAAADAEGRRRVEDLGYVSGGARETLTFDVDREDPKDFLPYLEKVLAAGELMHRRPAGPAVMPVEDRFKLAKRLLSEVLADRPENTNVHGMLARIAVEEGDPDRAARHYEELMRIEPLAGAPRHDLANVRIAQGRAQEARILYEEAVRLADAAGEPGPSVNRTFARLRNNAVAYEARLALSDMLVRQGELEAALGRLSEVLALPTASDRTRAEALSRRGSILKRLGRDGEAAEAFREAAAADPDYSRGRGEVGTAGAGGTMP